LFASCGGREEKEKRLTGGRELKEGRDWPALTRIVIFFLEFLATVTDLFLISIPAKHIPAKKLCGFFSMKNRQYLFLKVAHSSSPSLSPPHTL
jgi:hypothetical protein